MLDRESEIDAFKRVDLSVIASDYGFAVERKRSTASTVMMSNGTEKIAISYNGRHYIYWSVHDDKSNGTAIDFIQRVVEPGCNMGRVRQLLRPFLNSSYLANARQEHRGCYASGIKPNETDFQAVAERYSRFVPVDEPHPYLCDVRGIPFELLQSPRLYGRVRHCPRQGSVVFPHWGCPTQSGSDDRSLVGYEIKGQSVNMYSRGGKKGLFISAGMKGDNRLAVTESGLDALSYMAVRGEQGLRVASLSGKMNLQQPMLIRSAIERMEEGAQIVAAFDNDKAGDQLTQELFDLVAVMGRREDFLEDRTPVRGADWNKVLMDRARKSGPISSLSPQFGR